MSDFFIKKNESMVWAIVEEKTLSVCQGCSIGYGHWEVLEYCDGGCGETFGKGQRILCSEGRHYHEECFEEMKRKGQVEP